MSGYFGFNPITSRLDLDGLNGGGGGGGITSLVPDTGAAISSPSIDLVGMLANTTMVMQTLNNGGELAIENRTWETQYVVDTNATPGLRGTYTTIQAAMDAAAADGMSNSNPKKIILRNGSYLENLNIRDGSAFVGSILEPFPLNTICVILGNHTFDSICIFTAQGVQFSSNLTGSLFNGGSAAAYMTFNQCQLNQSDTTVGMFNVSGTALLIMDSCYVSGASAETEFINQLTVPNGITIKNTQFLYFGLQNNGGQINIRNSYGVGKLISDTLINAQNCSFNTGNDYNLQSPQVIANNCWFIGSSAGTAIDSNNAQITNCLLNSDNAYQFLSDDSMVNSVLSSKGNVLLGNRVDASTQLGDAGYIGITDTTTARTYNLNHICVDQEITITDESGGAGTNAITIQDFNGGTINGQANYVINTNGGSVTLHAIPEGDWSVKSSFPAGAPSGVLLAASNLSDLANAGTARTNLGVAIGSQVQAYDADLQAIAAIAATSGILCKTAANTWATRTMTAGTGLAILNPAGIAGDINFRVSGGGLAWTEAILFSQPTLVNTGYFSLVNPGVFALPTTTPALGDTIKIVGMGVATWTINQAAGQSIRVGNQTSTVGTGGSITSSTADDCIELVYANNGLWIATSYTGTYTVV